MPSVTYAQNAEMLNHLRRWLNAAFGQTFTIMDGNGICAVQDDPSSCGLCIVNAIDREVWGARFVTHETRDEWQVEYLADIIFHLVDQVSFPVCIDLCG